MDIKDKLRTRYESHRHYKKFMNDSVVIGLLNELALYGVEFIDAGALYTFMYPEKVKTCPTGNNIRFTSFSVGFTFCGLASNCLCVKTQVSKNVSTKKKAYSDEKRKEIKQKRELTVIGEYGVKNVFQAEKIKDKSSNTKIEKYNNKNYRNDKKRIKTLLENYGVDNPGKSKEVQQKMKDTCLARYGVEIAASSEHTKNKMKETCLNRYGVEFALLDPEIQAYSRKRMIETIMVDNPMNSSEIRQQLSDSLCKMRFEKQIEKFRDILTPEIAVDLYVDTKQQIWSCNKCGHRIERTIRNGKAPRCLKCMPYHISVFETEVQEYVKTIIDPSKILVNSKRFIHPNEIDILVLDYNFAIECNGVFYHSIAKGKHSEYHLSKFERSYVKDVRLIQIYDTEWCSSQDKIKSLIAGYLGCNSIIPSNDTKVVEVPKQICETFIQENSISGKVEYDIGLGIMYNKELHAVAQISLNSNTCTINGYCSKLHTQIPGGLDKILNFIEETFTEHSIYLIRDNRLSENLDLTNFVELHRTDPLCWETTTNGLRVVDANTLNYMDIPSLRNKIWDCGKSVFLKRNGR